MCAASLKQVRPALLLLLILSPITSAQEAIAENEDQDASQAAVGESTTEREVPEDSMSGSLDDSAGSIETARDAAETMVEEGWTATGDLRVGYVRSETELRDGTSTTETNWRGRFRIGASYGLNEWLIGKARIATSCTSDECDPSLTLDPTIDTRSTIDQGKITFDEFYLHVFRRKRFDVALGRLQTKFVARAGIFAKSLDRNNSHNFNVNWTDGIHGTYYFRDKSILHMIAEYNDSDGPSSVRRGALDFADSGSRVSYFVAWETQNRLGPLTQRGLDISYLPSALLKDGLQTGPIEDYIGIVARFASARPFGSRGARWNVAMEFGYAPETPTLAAAGLPGDGDTDGFAITFAASLMDVRPNHSIGFNYARADAGWLLSPQYRENEELVEIRYQWRKSRNLAFDFRVRGRKELERLSGESQERDETDFFARFTLGFAR